MKTNYFKRILLAGIILLNFIMVNAASVTGFTPGYWWQAAGFAGLGNQNELLAFGEYTIPKDNKGVTVKFKLQGEYAKFVNRVCLYACKYDSVTSSNSSKIAKTFEQLWDYRDPSSKVGAVLLSYTSNISGDEISLKGSGLEGGTEYVFFVTADIANKIDELPAIKGSKDNFTRIGAQITGMSSGTDEATLKQQHTGTNGMNDNGLRVLVPQLKTMYAPGDYYSKYYRIPAIVTAADGALVAVSDARKQHIHDITNDIDMLSRRSNDNGQTWSTPVTIAKGDSATKSMPAGRMKYVNIIDCENSIGYGDASLAALPNGDLLCAFIHGYGFIGNAPTKLSDNSYVISRDNGQTWGASKYMCDKDGNKLKLLTDYRGNIAPGNMCVVKNGLLAGKVLACYRTVTDINGNANNGNYFVTYDPSGDYWNILSNDADQQYSYSNYTNSNFFYQNSAKRGNGKDDEAQLIEIDKNTFLMSIRSEGTYQREFAIITLKQGNNNSVFYTATPLNNCGMELKEKANGAICEYTATLNGSEAKYLIHTVPTTQAASAAGNTTRSGLCVYTVKKGDVSANGFTWDKRLCISDPDDDLDETAQYSSITVQQDGTIGILFEDYPQVIRVEAANMGKINGSNICTNSGDYILRSRYMNLRINDILPDAEPIDKLALLPPIITPESQTYDVKDTDTWGDITIKNINPTRVSSTNYNIQVFDENNKLVKEITEGCSFIEDSLVLTWDGDKLAEVKNSLNAGYSVRVNAKCYTTDENYNSPSTAASQIYYFKHPTHKVKIVAWPFANSGDPTISIEGSTAEKDTWLTVGEGETITLYGGYGNEPFHFTGFSTDPNKSEFNSDFTPTKVTDNQYTVTIPNGYNGDQITFYARYASPAIGVKTRVNTNYYNSWADDAQWIDGKLTLIHKYEFTDWCNNQEYINTYDYKNCTEADKGIGLGKPQFPSFVDVTDYSNLKFANGEVEDATADELYYPTDNESTSYKKHGLDLTARIMSDTTTVQNYNAIVMVKRNDTYMTTTEFEKNTTNNATVQKAPSLKAAQSSYYYYVVNGYAYPFNTQGTIAQNAKGIKSWYTSGDAVLPEVSEAMAFNNAIDKTSSETPKYYVVFFIVNKNTLPSIQNLIDGKDYIYKVEHPIIPNANMTGVDVNKVANGLLIVGKQGCATFVSNAEQMVRVFNILGQQVAAFNLNGSHTVELPQGIYVANGQKFIVK